MAQTILAALPDMRLSEDPQDAAMISLTEAFTAAARRQPSEALRHAQDVLAQVDALGISHQLMLWAWPLAVRCAYDQTDAARAYELLVLLDAHQPGHLAPVLRAEQDLVRARLAAHGGEPAADSAFTAAVGQLRELSTPYHLAHGLLDHAQHLLDSRDSGAATLAIDEARAIGQRLRCQPLLDRAEAMSPAAPQVRA
jgi:hypothetical protein